MVSSSVFAVSCALVLGAWGSAITTYSDGECQKSYNNLNAVNGYPDGVCTPLEMSTTGTPKTFQIAKLDDGCAVTIYGPNEGPLSCSSSNKIIAEFGTCYNASWIYYSIDGCLNPTSSSIILPTSSSTSTATSQPGKSSSAQSNTGAIAGGVSGGVAGIALIFGVVFFLRRRKQQHLNNVHNTDKPLPPPPSAELSNDHQLMEAGRSSFVEEKAPMEVFGDEAVVEMGRNSSTMHRAELPGDSVIGDKKYEYASVEERGVEERDERKG